MAHVLAQSSPAGEKDAVLHSLRALAARAEDPRREPSSPPPMPPPPIAPPRACADCGTDFSAVAESGIRGYCQPCFERNVKRNEDLVSAPEAAAGPPDSGGIDAQAGAASDAELDREEPAEPQSATVAPAGSSSWSPWTWFQKIKAEEGVRKTDALQEWKALSASDRKAFMSSISQRISGHDDAEPPLKTQLASNYWSENRPASLDAFHKKWSSLKAKLCKAQDARTYLLQRDDVSFQLYVDIASLIRAGIFNSALAAENGLPEYHISRKKLARVERWWQENPKDDLQATPACFKQGRTHKGALTKAQKRDLLQHVRIMQRSNCTFTAKDAKKCMWRYYLLNIGAAKAEEMPDWSEFAKYEADKNMDNVPMAFRIRMWCWIFSGFAF